MTCHYSLRNHLSTALIGFIASMAFASVSHASPKSPWALQLSGATHHFSESKAKNGTWNEKNWGLGLQYDVPLELLGFNNPWRGILSASTLKDSFGAQGYFASSFIGYDVSPFEKWSISPMLGFMHAYRAKNFKHDMHYVNVFGIPSLAVEHKPSGIGMNLIAAPKKNKSPAFIFIQATYRF